MTPELREMAEKAGLDWALDGPAMETVRGQLAAFAARVEEATISRAAEEAFYELDDDMVLGQQVSVAIKALPRLYSAPGNTENKPE